MIAVAHRAVGMTAPMKPIEDLGEDIEEGFSIDVTDVDVVQDIPTGVI